MEDNQQPQPNTQSLPYHRHNGVDSPTVRYVDLVERTHSIIYRIVESTTAILATTAVGGDFVMPFFGHILEVGATVDTAGTTGTMTIDINKNGTTIMSAVKVTIDSAEKTSRTAATLPVVTTIAFVEGDIFTFDVDALHTTPAVGLSIFMRVVEDSR